MSDTISADTSREQVIDALMKAGRTRENAEILLTRCEIDATQQTIRLLAQKLNTTEPPRYGFPFGVMKATAWREGRDALVAKILNEHYTLEIEKVRKA